MNPQQHRVTFGTAKLIDPRLDLLKVRLAKRHWRQAIVNAPIDFAVDDNLSVHGKLRCRKLLLRTIDDTFCDYVPTSRV